MERDIRLDTLRGFVLARMTINHLSGPLLAYTKEDKLLILSNTYNPYWRAAIDQRFSPNF
jgi:hypothetical protein